jgi:hypothetical protein
MHIKKSVKNKSMIFWSILLLILSSAFMQTDQDSEIGFSKPDVSVSNTLRLNFYRANLLFKGDSSLIHLNSTVDSKWLKYRKKFKRLIDGNDDHEIYVKNIQYTSYSPVYYKIIYEVPYFVSEQHSFLFRLTVF